MKKWFLELLFLSAATATSAPALAATISLTGVIRDFNDSHPDFQNGIAVDPGIVGPLLGADGKPVYAGGTGTRTTHGKEAFDQWYRDVRGVNLADTLTITLDNTITQNPNIFTFIDNTFFPIDDQLFGNQGRRHNFHFTYELHSEFTYQGGETFRFTGDDDVFVYIDDRLVIDLGGVHTALSDRVILDRLGLTVGETYSFDLFYAERHTGQSNFRIDTSIALRQPPTPPTPGPIPEPGTLLLSAIGMLLLAERRARHG